MERKFQEQKQAINLRAKGYSLNEISDNLGVSKSSASLWVRKITLSSQALSRLNKRIIAGRARAQRTNRQRWDEYRKVHPPAKPDLELQKKST